MLYILHADEGRLTKIDYERRVISSLRLLPKLSWLENLLMLGAHSAYAKAANGSSLEAVVSLDGKMLYVTGLKQELRTVSSGDWEMETTPLNLRGIQTSDGTLEFEQEVFASGLSTSADGKRLFLHGSVDGSTDGEPATLIFDTSKRGMTGQYKQAYAWPGWLMDGTDVLVAAMAMEDGHSTRMLVFDARSQRKLAEWISTSYAEWIVNR
jgi:hypothetical protein